MSASKYLLSLYFFLLFFLHGCSEQENVYKPTYSETPPLYNKVYIFGVHPLHNPQRLFEVYQPLVDLINENLSNASLKLEASRNYSVYDKRLFSGYFDFALPNPYQSVMATQHGYKIFGKMGDDYNFRGIILVRKDSNIKSVMDLKGHTLSYPAPTALAATMMPQWYLYKHGLDINKDINNSYVGSQESSIMNVYLGKSIAASTWPPPWIAFMKERPEVAEELMIQWETQSLPNNGLVVKSSVPEDILKQVGDVIFSLHTHERGKKILKEMELSQFERADTHSYDSVRDFLKSFEAEVRPIRLQK